MKTNQALLCAGLLSMGLTSAASSSTRAAEDPFQEWLLERSKTVEEYSLERVWEESRALLDAAESLDSDSAGTLIDGMLNEPGELSDAAVLLLASVRMQTFEPDLGLVAQRLIALLEAREDLARGAAGLLGDPAFALLGSQDREQLADALGIVIDDPERSPALRTASAASLHERGDDRQRAAARRVLLTFLNGADAAQARNAALALAAAGDLESSRARLEKMRGLPGREGLLAEAYLKQEEIRTLSQRKLKNGAAYYQGKQRESELDLNPDLVRFERTLRLIEDEYVDAESTERQDLVSAALDAMLRSLDQHSSYLRPEFFKTFDQDLKGEYGGIGAYVGEDRYDKLFTITRPIYSGPAYRAGLRTNDKIVRIDDWSTVGEEVDTIIRRLKGKPGTSVRLYIWEKSMDPALIDEPTEEMAVEVVRETVVIPPVQGLMLPGKVGLVELTTFSRVATRELRAQIVALLEQGAESMILDLRNNSGGLLTEAANVADLFLPKRLQVVSTDSRIEDHQSHKTRRAPVLSEEMPMAVLINRFSASASEIVAGALQDHERAILVGQRSFGKGSVQKLYPVGQDDQFEDENGNLRYDPWEKITKDWDDNDEFDFAARVKLTMARYLLPSGRSIHHEYDREGNETSQGGVVPDITVELTQREQWRLTNLVRLNRSGLLREWAEEQYPEQREVFGDLALSDRDDASLYPAFEELYARLNTDLPRDDVRFLLRRELRRLVQDDRGATFPAGDFQEDLTLQRAVAALLEKRGQSYSDFIEYATTFDLDPKQRERIAHPGAPDLGVELVQDALSQVLEARRGGGQLSELNIERLRDILSAGLEHD